MDSTVAREEARVAPSTPTMKISLELRNASNRNFGGAFDVSSENEAVRFLYEHPARIAEEALAAAVPMDTAQRHEPYRLLAGFYPSDRLNAGTLDLDGGASVVAVSSAVPATLFRAFSAVLERADVLTLMPIRDDAGRLLVYPRRRRLVDRRANPLESLERVLERLQARSHMPLAMLLYDLAIRFIVMHECMHIVLGHTGYVRRAHGVRRLMEIDISRTQSMDPEFSRALEFIADRHAVRGVAHWARTGRLGEYAEAIPRDASLDLETYLHRGLTLSLVTLLLLFPSRPSSRASEADSHPHSYVRMRWLSRELEQDIASQSDFIAGVLEPMAYWTASFQRNFSTPGRWTHAIAEDQNVPEGEMPLADRAYQAVNEMAGRWQTDLWRDHSPLYPGDGRSLEVST